MSITIIPNEDGTTVTIEGDIDIDFRFIASLIKDYCLGRRVLSISGNIPIKSLQFDSDPVSP